MSTSHIVYLPNGQSLTVKPVFGGLFFRSNELNLHNTIFPAGWTIVIQSEDYGDEHESAKDDGSPEREPRAHHIHRYTKPTLHNDNIFISSISNPSTADFKPAQSPTRLIAMMLWATLYWYFHQPEPSSHLVTEASRNTPEAGRPRGDWRINVKREGVFRGRHLLQKLERMGLLSSEDSSVGSTLDENGPEGWSNMFTSRRAFWMMSARLFLFTLTPMVGSGSLTSPYNSRPSSPARSTDIHQNVPFSDGTERGARLQPNSGVWSPQTPGPFASGSHLPTYYPPAPMQYTMTDGVRHPIRPKPPRQGETFYLRFVPSQGQYLSFRVASLHDQPVAYSGPTSVGSSLASALSATHLVHSPTSERGSSSPSGSTDTRNMTDLQLLHKWMNEERVAQFWGCKGPVEVQEKFLRTNLESRHSFPVIGCWDGKPFGYFEVYWVKEDILGKHLSSGDVDDYDRGVHVLVGEQEFRGKHRLECWISALVHYAFIADYRTNSMVLEPRVDNVRFINHLQDFGFAKEKEVTFPHKQSAFVRLKREVFDGPAL